MGRFSMKDFEVAIVICHFSRGFWCGNQVVIRLID